MGGEYLLTGVLNSFTRPPPHEVMMVAKNQNSGPNEPAGRADFQAQVQLLLQGLIEAGLPKGTLPKDDPAYLAKYADSAAKCADQLRSLKACPCPRCKLSMFETAVSEYVCAETVRAAVTGDTSKLQQFLDLIAAQKAEGK